ncbi:hypothetical protein [Pseudogemmobacter sonorensis]|uniref:hypothetical protein n=1 Tax=Pseudogemmobacter sonorensis TaxID=2989681 RepID=UPI0036BCA201
MRQFSHDTLESGSSGRGFIPEIDAGLERIFHTFDQRLSGVGAGLRPIAFVTSYDSAGRQLCTWVEELGAIVMIITDRSIPPEWISNRNGKLECLVINEAYTGPAAGASIASRFRQYAPEVPIVVLRSAAFEPNSARVWAGIDAPGVSVRLPVGRTELKLGVLSAIDRLSGEASPQGAVRSGTPDQSADPEHRGLAIGLRRAFNTIFGARK